MAIKASFSRGILNASGDKLDNTITFGRDLAGNLLVNNGAVLIKGATPTMENTDLIQASGSAGNDTITVDETNGPMPSANLSGGAGDDVLMGGSADDVLSGGAGLDKFIWNPGDGHDLIEGGSNGLDLSGVDKLFFNGDAADEHIDLSANGGRVSLSRDGNVVIDANDVECIYVNPLRGSDAIVVNDLSGTDVLQVNIDLASTSGGTTGDSQIDSVTINYSGQASLSLGRSIDPITLEPRLGVGLGQAWAVTISHADASDLLIINGSASNDMINAAGVPLELMMTLTINGAGGNDTITGSRGGDTLLGGDGDDVVNWNAGGGNDIIEGGAGFDTLLSNGADANENINISANGDRVSFLRAVANVIADLNDVERIDLRAFGGSDTIVINDLSGTDVTEVNIDLAAFGGGGDGQADTITINAAASDDPRVVNDGSGNVTVLGVAALVTITGFELGDQIIINQ